MEIANKLKLRRSLKSWLLHSLISTFLLYFLYVDVFYGFIVFFLAFFTFDILVSFSITSDYFEKNGTKILYKDIVDVRKVFFWIVIVDRYGDSLSFMPQWFCESDKSQLEKALDVSFSRNVL